MNENLVNDDKLGSDEFEAIDETKQQEIPTFGIEPAETKTQEELDAEAAGKTPEELEQERLAAEAAGKTPEELEQERLAAEAAGKTPEELDAEKKLKEEQSQKEAIDAQKAELLKEVLKEAGVTSLEELKKLKNPAKPETEDEKRIRLENHEASFLQFAVAQNKMSLTEIQNYKQLSALPSKDLVYADFANEFKAANVDRKDVEQKADPVTDDEIQTAFDDMYHTDSDNPVLKKAGERALTSRAKEILSEPEKKYNDAKEEFDFLSNVKIKMPEFKTFVQGTLKEVIPDKKTFTVDGEEFSVELDGKDFAEIESKFKHDNVFNQFLENDRQGLKTSIQEEANRQLSNKYEAKVAEIAYRSGHAAGLKAGKVGARAPFEKPAPPSTPVANGKLTTEEKENIRAGHQRV